MTQINLNLPDEIMDYLQQEADKRSISLDEVVSEVLTDYFEEPTHEELLAGLQRSLKQVLTGEYRSARDFLDELDTQDPNHADSR